jgi:hypothetical protein
LSEKKTQYTDVPGRLREETGVRRASENRSEKNRRRRGEVMCHYLSEITNAACLVEVQTLGSKLRAILILAWFRS